MKRTPLKRKTPLKRGGPIRSKHPFERRPTAPRKGLRAVSERRRRELQEYSERRKSFLARPDNQWCPVAAAGLLETNPAMQCLCGTQVTAIAFYQTAMKKCLDCGRGRVHFRKAPRPKRTTDVHHRAGRNGKRLNDERFWLAVSREGHEWIHNNPNAAREYGWLL